LEQLNKQWRGAVMGKKNRECDLPMCFLPAADMACEKWLCVKHLPSPDQGLYSNGLRSAKNASPESIQRNAETVLVQAIRIRNLEAMISGMTEAMRPMLEEWKKLKDKEDV
jgi:hypothetical protein